jgi:hypothetical protein
MGQCAIEKKPKLTNILKYYSWHPPKQKMSFHGQYPKWKSEVFILRQPTCNCSNVPCGPKHFDIHLAAYRHYILFNSTHSNLYPLHQHHTTLHSNFQCASCSNVQQCLNRYCAKKKTMCIQNCTPRHHIPQIY